MTLNVDPDLSASADAPRSDPPGDAASRRRRQQLADDLLEELTSWAPRDRIGTFKSWHRGALSLVHLNVVAALEASGPLSMSQLADALDVSVASITGIVDRMEQRQLVERRHATDDRRLVRVHLAEAGRSIFRDLQAGHHERLSRLLQELSDEELAGFLKGLRAMRAARARLMAEGHAEEHAAPPAAASTPAEPPAPTEVPRSR